MLVAIFSVHIENGWQAVADSMSPFPPADIEMAGQRLEAAKSLMQQHGNYDWLTGSGSFVKIPDDIIECGCIMLKKIAGKVTMKSIRGRVAQLTA